MGSTSSRSRPGPVSRIRWVRSCQNYHYVHKVFCRNMPCREDALGRSKRVSVNARCRYLKIIAVLTQEKPPMDTVEEVGRYVKVVTFCSLASTKITSVHVSIHFPSIYGRIKTWRERLLPMINPAQALWEVAITMVTLLVDISALALRRSDYTRVMNRNGNSGSWPDLIRPKNL